VASAEKQAAFIASYEKLMRGLLADEAVYFADAVHSEYQAMPAFGWVKVGSNPAVLSTAGRGPVNIHKAVNLKNLNALFVEPTSVDMVNAVQLLTKIEERNPDKRIIHVIWDNAAYHKAPDVRAFPSSTSCRIHLIQLPPYCPHLNSIKRPWGVLHQYVTHDRYHASQTQFAHAILALMREIIPQEWKTFRDKVSDNFRVINHEKFRVLE
jgi:transposase